tara:strand:- start:399 stop:1364 length:966 start_codon:yes stop_codon:yes gene_type:complete
MKNRLDKIIGQTLEILRDLGLPIDEEFTQRRKERMAKAIMALMNMKPNKNWSKAKKNLFITRDIIRYINEHLEEKISLSSYDDIRRKDLKYPEEAGIVEKSSNKKNSSTNDGTRAFAITDIAFSVFSSYGSEDYYEKKNIFINKIGNLKEKLKKERDMAKLPVTLSNGKKIKFSPDKHNQIQKAVIEKFLPNFGYNSEVLYVGDTENKFLHLEKDKLEKIGFFKISHDKLPDIVAYSKDKNWIYLIEAVYTSGPIDEIRKSNLESLTKDLNSEIVFITAFLDKTSFRKFAKDIAWETEVWIADNPTHLIHFNGDKFLGPYK